ncbi:MAG TPA: SRPBCC family protein [Candidatus Binatus sp.]|nr:SRPBCC family protein [Candidatus Binatus sp.]
MCRFPGNETRYTTFDARPGGTNLMQVRSQDGTTYKQRVTFREIRPPEKLVFAWSWEKFSPAGQKIGAQEETLVTVEFQPRGTFTEVFLTHEGFTDAQARADHNKGWNGCFDALEKTLEA